MQGAWVPYLVEELISCVVWPKKKKKKSRITIKQGMEPEIPPRLDQRKRGRERVLVGT